MISFSNEELHKLLRTVADGNTDRHEGIPDDVERAEARATLQLNACSIISHLLADYEHLREQHFGGVGSIAMFRVTRDV